MKKALRLMLAAAVTAAVLLSSTASVFAVSAAATADRPVLKFNSSGKFTVLMFNDTQDTDKTIKDTVKLIVNSLDKVKPDLVVLDGDNIAGTWLGVNEAKVRKAIDNIVAPINDRNIPFAIVFGNHDQESGVSKETQMKMYQTYKNCLAVDEGSGISNCGTYNLPIKDSTGSKNVFNIWMIDSGTSAAGGGYQSVNADQIAWYERTSDALKQQNGGKSLPSLLFQHIPVPEIYDLLTVVPKGTKGAIEGYRTNSKNYYVLNTSIAAGKLLEAPCSPDKNSGEFAAWVKQGDILGAYFGHDHVNDLKGTLDGIDLGYTPGAGFNMYGNGVYRGVRTFELDESNLNTYKTQVLYYKDLVSPKADTTINDSYFSNELRVAIPMLLSAIIGLMVALLLVITLVKRIRRGHTKVK
ncbi:MAG: metallophosphoesterase family protein [Clostridia bacterium]|nr:metallophosphoesterase family protein [Clostridia bacterium]